MIACGSPQRQKTQPSGTLADYYLAALMVKYTLLGLTTAAHTPPLVRAARVLLGGSSRARGRCFRV
jgi:hypothetical protein